MIKMLRFPFKSIPSIKTKRIVRPSHFSSVSVAAPAEDLIVDANPAVAADITKPKPPEFETSLDEIERIYHLQRANEANVARTTAADRIAKLQLLHDVVMEKRQDVRDAVYAEKGNNASEVDLTEIYAVTHEIKHVKHHLAKWMKPQRQWTPLALTGATSWIHPEPKGVCLIMSPWNFPVNLTLGPLISAIAAGNTSILKPSEMSPNSAQVIREIVEKTFDEEEVAVVEGGIQTSTDLLAQPFNHIFFTGSPQLGSVVMQAAAKHLASVTLELGGKSPVIVDDTANIKVAAHRIAWSKNVNCGQICIAPDYVMVHSSKKNEFIQEYASAVNEFYGDKAEESDSYGRIVNGRHHARLDGVLEDAIAQGAKVEYGGNKNASNNFFEPTILSNPNPDSKILQDEIFGPLLPIMTYESIDETIDFINAKEKPLAMYIFTNSNENSEKLINATRAGATVINHCLIHFFNSNLPFGGSNNSGIGKSHGIYGFREFTNERAVLKQWSPIFGIDLMAPPYEGRFKKMLVDLTIKFF